MDINSLKALEAQLTFNNECVKEYQYSRLLNYWFALECRRHPNYSPRTYLASVDSVNKLLEKDLTMVMKNPCAKKLHLFCGSCGMHFTNTKKFAKSFFKKSYSYKTFLEISKPGFWFLFVYSFKKKYLSKDYFKKYVMPKYFILYKRNYPTPSLNWLKDNQIITRKTFEIMEKTLALKR